jgi:hypothetical protein
MSAVAERAPTVEPVAVRVEDMGELVPVSRAGGQGRVYRPSRVPASLGPDPLVVKLYRHPPPDGAAGALAEMVFWARALPPDQRAGLRGLAAWPLAIVWTGDRLGGIVMRDVSGRFSVPFVMPSGRRERVLLTLEHLLGGDDFLQLRGLRVRLDTVLRARVAERICAGLAFLHRHAIVASDIAPNNLLVALGGLDGPEICFIDCDSMVFHGRQALPAVQTGDWNIPAAFEEPPSTRAADAYKLGLVILRLFARSHDARTSAPHLRYVPVELRDLLERALGPDAANRPPAGEWQRALRGVLAGGGLGARHPGPAPAPRVPPARRIAADSPTAPAPRIAIAPSPGATRAARPVAAAASRAPRAPAPRAGGAWLRRAVVLMWLVAGTIVLAIVLSRLFAAAVPIAGGGATGANSYPGAPYGYQYYYPGGGGYQGQP